MNILKKIACIIICLPIILLAGCNGSGGTNTSNAANGLILGDLSYRDLSEHIIDDSDNASSGDVNSDSSSSNSSLGENGGQSNISLGSWKPVPLVSQSQLDKGYAGGEGCQWPLNIVYSHDGNTAFLGTDVGGLYKSTDSGKTWTPATVGLNASGATGTAIDPNNVDRVITVGVNSGPFHQNGLYLSTNAGETWKGVCNMSIVGHRDFRQQVAFDASSYSSSIGGSSIIYWSRETKSYNRDNQVYSPALYKSTDGGNKWSVINTNATIGGSIIFCHPTKGYLYAANPNGVFKSTDGGVSFTKILDGEAIGMDVISSRPDNIYVTKQDGLYVSTNSGGSFSKVSNSGYPQTNPSYIRVSPANPDLMVLQDDKLTKNGTYNNVTYYSKDGGKTWNESTRDSSDSFIPFNSRQNPFSWNPKNANMCLTTGGDFVMRSTDGAKTFTMSNDGYNGVCSSYIGINVNNPNLMFVSSQDYSGAYTIDCGKTWKYISWYESWGGMTYGGYAADANTVIVTVKDISNKYGHGVNAHVIAYTTDGGKTVKITDHVVTGNKVVTGVVGDENIIIAGEWRSTDKGKTWSKITNCKGVASYNSSDGTLYGMNGKYLVKSTDKGQTWNNLTSFKSNIKDVAYNNGDGSVWVLLDDGSSVFKYIESSSKTETISTFPKNDQISNITLRSIAIDPVNPDIIYLSNAKNTYQSPIGVLKSTDGGKTWSNLARNPNDGSTGLDGGKEVSFIRVNPLTRELYAICGCRGVWKFSAPK